MRSIGYKNISSFTIIFMSTFKFNSIEHVFYGIKSTLTSNFNGFLLNLEMFNCLMSLWIRIFKSQNVIHSHCIGYIEQNTLIGELRVVR